MARTSSDRRSRATRRLLTVVALLLGVTGIGLVIAGNVIDLRDRTGSDSVPVPFGSPSLAPTPTASSKPARDDPATGVPAGVSVPRLGLDVPVIRIHAVGGVLTPPADPLTLGWDVQSARPGQVLGGAVITGHTVHTGGGALDDLGSVPPGTRVVVRTARGSIPYAVRAVEVLSKSELARRAQQVFSLNVPGRLVLITCTDWDGEEYLSNVVVYAAPARAA